MSKIKAFFSKIKSIKFWYVYLAVFVGLCAVLFYFVNFKTKQNVKTNDNSTTETSSAMEYVNFLENKLSNVLSKISGAGQTQVIITLESGFAYEYATDTETKTINSGGTETSVTTQTIILVSSQPVVQREIYPVIKGVVVVAKGASDVNVKLNILAAVETALEVARNKITILF